MLFSQRKSETATKPETFANDEGEVDVQNILADLKARSKGIYKRQIVQLDWEEMQQLIAGLMRAMGYKTRVSPTRIRSRQRHYCIARWAWT